MLQLRVFPLILLILLLVGTSAHARPEYAQQENRPCKACHVRSGFGGLNDEGRAFKAAATAGKSSAPTTTAAPVQEKHRRADAAATPAAGKDVQPSEAVTEKKAAAIEDDEEDDETVKPPPTVIYRWQGSDGSMVFSERPSPPAPSHKKEPGGKQARKAVKGRKVVAIKSRPPEKKTVQAAVPSATPKESFQDCMERILIDEPEADSADGIMAILTAARETCSGFTK